MYAFSILNICRTGKCFMQQNAKPKIDTEKLKAAIYAGIPLTITTYMLPDSMLEYMRDVLELFLEEQGQQGLLYYLSYCLGELVGNAKKANTKRAYFLENHLDITNQDDYTKGMQTFKEATLKDINHFLSLQKKMGLYIKLILQVRGGKLRLEVRNNANLTFFEYKRVHDKLSRAQHYDSMEQVFGEVLDSSEGAGLGIIIMILMLKKMGLSEENYQIMCQDGITINRIILPLSIAEKSELSGLSSQFVSIIDSLPQFPDNIQKINILINNPNSKMQDIARQISSDVSLTADLLKFVNSATFGLHNPCRNVGDAVKLVGIKGLKNMLLTIASVHTLIDSNNAQKRQIWNHSNKVAFFSYNLAMNFLNTPQDKMFLDDSYICGLLHDMGKVIFETAHPALLAKLQTAFGAKNIPQQSFEMLLSGANHSEIGALLAQKWNFPDSIALVIRFHHTPQKAPPSVAKLVAIVFLADTLVHYNEGKNKEEKNSTSNDLSNIQQSTLDMLGIDSIDRLQNIGDRLSKAFEKQ